MLAALLCSHLSLSPVQGFTTMGPKPLSFSTAARTQKRRLNEQPVDDSGSFSQSSGEWSEVPVAEEQTPSVADDVPTPFLSLDSDFVGDQQVFAQQADDIFASGTEAMTASELLKELTNDPPPAILGDDVVESLLNVSPLDLAMNADSPTEDGLSSVVDTNNDNDNVDIQIISWDEVEKASASDMLDSSILDDVTVASNSNDGDVVNTGMVSPELSDLDAVLEASRQAAVEAEAILTSETAPVEPIESNENISIPPQARAMVDEDISQAIREPLMTERVEAPSVNKILKFAIPAIGVWLCSPLLSLIDTSAVGLLSGTAQQAALNPAVAVTDYAALLIVSVPVYVKEDECLCVYGFGTSFASMSRCLVSIVSYTLHSRLSLEPPSFLNASSRLPFFAYLHDCASNRHSCTQERRTLWLEDKSLIVAWRENRTPRTLSLQLCSCRDMWALALVPSFSCLPNNS